MQTIELRFPDGRIVIVEVSDERYALVEQYATLRGLTFGAALTEILQIGLEEIERYGILQTPGA